MIVEFFRAVPVRLMIFAYFLYALYDVFLSKQLSAGRRRDRLTLYNAAVIAEIVRAGVNRAAARAVGGRRRAGIATRSDDAPILLPQAITSMLPVLVSQLVVVLKDTAIGYQITPVEMVRQGTVVGLTYGNYVPALIVIASS